MDIDIKTQLELYNFIAQFISEERKLKFQEIIEMRTRHLTVVIEDVYQSQNASAVLRTCDCFGIQDVHIIENRNEFNICKDVELGSSKWLSIKKYNKDEQNTLNAFENLRSKGYRIVATSPHRNDQELGNLPVDGKLALVFGTELNGLSQIALDNVDEFVKIPMHGFTESFNISVSAGIFLANLSDRIRKSEINWKLTEDEKVEVMLGWAKNAVKNPEVIVKGFFKKNKK
jgi:tRNA (guanosine-2'-O-)-methyltransferase